jgi:hypothetical protein
VGRRKGLFLSLCPPRRAGKTRREEGAEKEEEASEKGREGGAEGEEEGEEAVGRAVALPCCSDWALPRLDPGPWRQGWGERGREGVVEDEVVAFS